MKKLVLFAATIVAISFASCSGSANTAATPETDSVTVETTVETVVDSAATVATDSAATVETVVAQ